ncbi:TraR/DksA C4-type zinc finger protein [Bacillus massiliigorillae]|uniref:TraR/DksA C4-type zinc finger protein n=1 Tax=Bacillus massiliigorillae TaxID=1243664 RepID=UPI0003A0B83C|nr:TraR/DksA C4-type zinc finger protein [Bacillus massiliigorillae]
MTIPNKIQHFKQLLLQQRDEIEHTIERSNYNADERSLKNSVDELSSYDNHPADLGTELFEREKDHALEEHALLEIEKIDLALKAIEEGTYGKCIICGVKIPDERLEVVPYSLYCVEHTPEQNLASDYRPVEEDIIRPPETNSYDTNKSPYISDYLDSFQEVARYGTSETPSDFVGDYDTMSSLYNDGDDQEGFTEDIETFIATDITGENIIVVPSVAHENYEEVLDDENIESIMGDIPYRKTDGYEE